MELRIKFDHPYTIGRKSDNEIIVSSNDISGHHAQVTCLGEETFLLEDSGSTNGTFINGRQIKRAICSRADAIRLAQQELILDDWFPLLKVQAALRAKYDVLEPIPAVKEDPNDFTVEFQELGPYYELYKKGKADLNKKHQNMGGMLRLAPAALLSGIGLYLGGEYRMDFITLASSVGGVIGLLLSNSVSPAEKLAALEEEFRIKYACPKCLLPFNQTPWPALAMKKICDRCKAIWVR